MSPTGTKEKFEAYRNWFKALMMKEFLNLPVKSQDRFIAIVERFLKDCKRLRQESEEIMEKEIRVSIKGWSPSDDKSESITVHGTILETGEEIHLNFPPSVEIKPGTITYMMYSLDGEIWYSSKTELITGRKS